MTDPMDALNGLQAALDRGAVKLNPCELHPEMKVLLDHPNGAPRFTYSLLDKGEVQAIALFVSIEPVQGLPCFQVGYAVTELLRGKGIGVKLLQLAIDELKHGLSRTPMREFYLEAIVSTGNVASNKIARRLISDSPNYGDDMFSKGPVYQYLCRVHFDA